MEDDFSSTTSTSGRVAVGGTASGNIETAHDRDWFAVELVAGRTYTIDLRGSPTDDGTLSDPYLYGIRDADGNLIASTTDDNLGDGRNSRVTFTATESGTHYIAAGAYGSRQGTYTVEVTDNSPADTDSQTDTPTPTDADATRTGAVDFGDITALQGPRFPRGTLDGDADGVDYYRFTLTEAKRVGLGLRQQDADADLFLEDANGTVLYSSTASGTANERIDQTLLAGTYYVRVESQEAGVNAHVVRYGVSAPDADALAALQQQSGTGTDEAPTFGQQGYAFALAENADGSTSRVSLGTVAATDPEGSTPVYSLVGDSGSFEIDAASGELYYTGSGEDYESGSTSFNLTVRASDGDQTSDTTVTVNVTDVDEPVVGDPPGSQLQETTPQTESEPAGEDFSANTSTRGRVAVGETATGNIGTHGDRDWFAVELVAGREYQIDLRGSATQDGTLSDPYLRGIHDAEGNLISRTRNDDWGGTYNSQVTFTATESGTHYIAAGSFTGTRGTYELEVTDNSPLDVQDPVAQGDSALPMIRVADAEATEGDDTWIVFRVTLDRAASGPVTVSYTTANGTAQAGTDYLEAYGALTFAAGETEKTVRVTIVDDAVEDSGETFRLVLSDPTGAELADAEAVGTILNTERADDYAADTTTTGTVSVGGSQTGELESAGDADWMKVTLVGGTRYVIDYEGAETGRGTLFDPYLRGVYDANGNLISGTTNNNGGQGFNSRIDFTPDSSGTYFLGLGTTSPFLPGGTYRVRVTEIDDDYENDTTTTGSVAVGGSATGNLQYFSDHDWFRVTFDEGTTYRIDIKGSWTDHGTLRDTRIAGIYDSNGDLIDGTADDNSGIDTEARTIFTAPTAGTYYIAFARGEFPFPTQNSGTYTVEVAEVGDDDYAANTTTSGSVAADGSTTGTIERPGDLDWFAVTLEINHVYRFDVQGIGEDWPLLEGKFIRGIYDSNGNPFAGSYTPEALDGQLQVEFTPARNGTYYVAIGAWETFFGTGEYRLSVTKFTPEVSDWLDTHAHAVVDGSVTGELEEAHDRDWFRVTLEAGTTYQIGLEGSPTSRGTLADPYLHGVYDSEGDLIFYTSDDNSGVGHNSSVNFTPDTDGTYYVAAGALFGRTGTYELSVDEVM